MMVQVETADGFRDRHQPWIEDLWADWFGNSARELGNPSRVYAWDADGLPEWIEANEMESRPSFVSTSFYGTPNKVSLLDRLFFDFDSPDLDKAWEDASGLARALERYYGIKALLCFSGRKGYHVHVWLKQPVGGGFSQGLLKMLYAELQRGLLRGLSYESLDPAVIGDVKRLGRIPYSRHQKSGRLCVPVDESRRPVLLTPGFVSTYRDRGIQPELVKLAVKRVNKEIVGRSLQKPRRRLGGGIRPCIEAALTKSHLSHLMRVAVVAELHAEGWPVSRIISAFSGMADYDRRKTAYFVKHAIKTGYRPFKCSTIDGLGGCLHSECPIYRRRRK